VLDLTLAPEGAPLKSEYHKGFDYSDYWVDDARPVVLNAHDTRDKSATILTRTACASALRENGAWRIETTHARSGEKRVYRAKAIVNASGPWVEPLF